MTWARLISKQATSRLILAERVPPGTNRGGSALNLRSYAWQRRIERRECSSWDLACCSLSAASCIWHALRFGGDRLAGRLATLWSRHGAAWASWGSKRTGRGFSLWQSVQFCWCGGSVSNPRAPSPVDLRQRGTWPASAKRPDAPLVVNFDQPFPFGQLILDLTPHGSTAFIGDENAGCAPAIL